MRQGKEADNSISIGILYEVIIAETPLYSWKEEKGTLLHISQLQGLNMYCNRDANRPLFICKLRLPVYQITSYNGQARRQPFPSPRVLENMG